MKILKNKFLTKLIVSLCLFLVLVSFGGTSKVYAADDQIWGGKLLAPVLDLLTAIGDAIMEILHESIQEQEAALIQINSETNVWKWVCAIVCAIIVAVVVIAVVMATAGGAAAGAAALAAKIGVAGTTVKAAFVIGAASAAGGALFTGVVAGVAVASGMIPDDIYLPAFSISAEEIFKNKIALFDINFFNPNKYYTDKLVKREDHSTEVDSAETEGNLNLFTDNGHKYEDVRDEAENLKGQTITVGDAKNKSFGTVINKIDEKLPSDKKITSDMDFIINERQYSYDAEPITQHADGKPIMEKYEQEYKYVFSIRKQDSSTPYLYIVHRLVYNGIKNYNYNEYGIVSSETTSENTTTEYLGYELASEEGGSSPLQNTEVVQVELLSTAAQLQGIISTWYFILRNISLLVLMLLLIYTGIRIVMASTAGEKAKYKERITDWLVAMCLIFIMHYIMVFAIELVEKLVDLVSSTTSNGNMAQIVLTEKQETNAKEILEGYNTIGQAYDKNGNKGVGAIAYKDENGNAIGDGHGVIIWPTDLAGIFRIQSQITESGTIQWVGYALCYVVLVLFTLFFAFTYAKRVLYMAFLTMIAPLVAMTYPIDKITDGKAQAFDSWLKEYIFNLMIQPLHILLYTVLVSSAYSLASKSPIYALVAIGFMMPAEKLMRRFFGFEKAKTPGLLGGAAGAASHPHLSSMQYVS